MISNKQEPFEWQGLKCMGYRQLVIKRASGNLKNKGELRKVEMLASDLALLFQVSMSLAVMLVAILVKSSLIFVRATFILRVNWSTLLNSPTINISVTAIQLLDTVGMYGIVMACKLIR